MTPQVTANDPSRDRPDGPTVYPMAAAHGGSTTRDALFRTPSGAIARRVELENGRPPQFVDLPARNAPLFADRYVLAVPDPVRPVYRWHSQVRNKR